MPAHHKAGLGRGAAGPQCKEGRVGPGSERGGGAGLVHRPEVGDGAVKRVRPVRERRREREARWGLAIGRAWFGPGGHAEEETDRLVGLPAWLVRPAPFFFFLFLSIFQNLGQKQTSKIQINLNFKPYTIQEIKQCTSMNVQQKLTYD